VNKERVVWLALILLTLLIVRAVVSGQTPGVDSVGQRLGPIHSCVATLPSTHLGRKVWLIWPIQCGQAPGGTPVRRVTIEHYVRLNMEYKPGTVLVYPRER